MTTESKKLQTFTKGDITVHAAKFPAARIEALRSENAMCDGLDRDTCVDLLTQAEIAHEQREVIRRLVGAGRHAENCTGAFDRPCNCGWESAVVAAVPFLED